MSDSEILQQLITPRSPAERGGVGFDRLPISVHVLTWNSGATLEKTLNSVRECEEVLVIDGGSTDNTLEIAKRFGATIVQQRSTQDQGKPLTDFSVARNAGLEHATKPWILSMDSDEYASPVLLEEIHAIIEKGEPCACKIPRRYVLPDGFVVTHATTYPNERLYFFNRDAVTRWIKPVHERPELKPGTKIIRLRGASLAPLGTIEEYRRKNLQYLEIEREKSRGKGWGHWLKYRVWHTFKSRAIALVKLLWIWLLPHRGVRLPLRHELLRFWYGWKLVVTTMPTKRNETIG
ncbi:MAG: glycosyltransferase family 2 protein [Candidatus Peregrinibacteria bacterium]|nr:glycosyltransferase family 2 protein [Candidatus Peregrinibacteria bacterium]